MVKCKLVLDESVLSTLHRGGEGQNVYRMIFSTLVTKVVGSGGLGLPSRTENCFCAVPQSCQTEYRYILLISCVLFDGRRRVQFDTHSAPWS